MVVKFPRSGPVAKPLRLIHAGVNTMNALHRTGSMALLAILLAGSVLAKSDRQALPQVTEDGLQLLPDSKAAVVYAKPGSDLSGYGRIHLVDAYVAFRKNWERDQRASSSSLSTRIKSSDVEKIKASLAQEFDSVFREELEKGGYQVVDEIADDVLIVRPAIINLDINAPDIPTAGRSKTYASSAGEMTLYVELIDSVTGDIFAKAIDRQVDGSRGSFYTWTNSVSNKAAADRIIKGWATILREALDAARQQPAAE
jgi:hypothetical protein